MHVARTDRFELLIRARAPELPVVDEPGPRICALISYGLAAKSKQTATFVNQAK